jgi:ABC-2 type transport system permease protein
MVKLIFAEYQKLKRTFSKKMVLLAPLAIVFLCANLGLGESFQKGSYNWWSSFVLPGALTLICANVIEKDKKKIHYHGILSLPSNPVKIWAGKIGTCVFLYLISCMVFFAGVTLGGLYYGSSVSLMQSAVGNALLFITFLWQIPLCMFFTDRMGLFPTVFINLAGNMLCTTFASRTSHWKIPYAIPARLMCPVIKVLPNGLSVPANDPLLSTNVILPGILITLTLFIALSVLTALPYRKLEVK